MERQLFRLLEAAELIIPSQPFDKTKVIKEKNHIWILYKIDAIFWLVVLTTIFIIGIVRDRFNFELLQYYGIIASCLYNC